MSILIGSYLLKVIFISGLLFGYYRWALYDRPFHLYNRFFLLGIPLLSLTVPLIPLPFAGSIWSAAGAIPVLPGLHGVIDGNWREQDAIVPSLHGGSSLPFWGMPVAGAYLLVSFILLFGFFRQLCYVRRLTRLYSGEKIGPARFFNTHEPGTPFSFLGCIFWNDRMELASATGRQIFRHELNHVRQKHSLDLLLLRPLTALCWINPFFHLIYREIRAIHEFLADHDAVSEGDRYAYAESLVWQTVHIPSTSLLHPFFKSPIKRRITMITQTKNTCTNQPAGQALLGKAMILPLLFLLFCAFGTKHPLTNIHIPTADKPLTVVIDAGHGGIDPGAINKLGVQEKDLNLAIAEKIKSLAEGYNIRVLMTRESDELAGSKSTKRESLEYRAQMANDNKADIFLSIHTDMDASAYVKGFNIFVSEQNAHYAQCVQVGSALIETLKKSYPTETTLKKREAQVYVLGNTNMPAVLLECGNMENEKDLSFISKDENRTNVARAILEGLRNYSAWSNK